MKKRTIVLVLIIFFSLQAAVWGFEVTDALGRTVTFDRPPERIVIAGRAIQLLADAVYLFPDAERKVAAVEDKFQRPKNFIPVIDPAYGQKILLPVDVGAEEVAAVRPDLVLMKTYMRGKLGKPLENLGVPVVYLNFESPEEYLREIEMLGKIMDSPRESAEIRSFYLKRLDLVAGRVGGMPERERPAVLFVSYTQKGGTVSFNVPPRSWLQSILIERAGGRPVWTTAAGQQGWQKTGFEQMAVWDPDYIIVTSYSSNVDEVTGRLKEDPLWAALRAVKEGKLLGFPGDFLSWDQPDTRWILGLLWMAKQFHPEMFPELSVPSEARLFYRKMYGIGESDYRQKVQPLLQGDLE